MKPLNSSNKKRVFSLTTALAIMSALVILLCFFMVEQSNRMIREDTTRYLSEISRQASYKVNEQVSFKLSALSAAAENLMLFDPYPAGLSQSYLANVEDQYSFIWIGYAGKDRMLVSNEAEAWDVSDIPVIQDAFEGKAGVSDSLITNKSGNRGVLYAVPCRSGEEVTGVLAGWASTEDMKDFLAAETFGGQGFSHIIDRYGNFIIRSENPHAKLEDDSIYDALGGRARMLDGGSVEELKANIRSNKTYHLHVMLDGSIDEDMNYVPLDNGGWYLVSVVPGGVYSGMINSFTQQAIALNMAIFVIFLTLTIVVVFFDNRKNKQIERIAYEDPVTGGFTAPRFDLEISRLSDDFRPYAFLSLDIRKFKLINDAFGSTDGNRVLKHTHDVILRHLNPGEYASRISADTFNILFLTTDQEEISRRINSIAEDLNAFNRIQKTPYYLPIDCGIYIVKNPAEDIITIRDRANTARKHNKGTGNGGHQLFSCVFYSDVERIQLLKEKEIENRMEGALEQEEFVVYLQPKVDLETGCISGAEALVRWQTPDQGLIPPNDFIPFFEKNGFIRKLDLYVFEKVCRLLRDWIDRGLEPVPVSVNLSRVHLQVPDFLDKFKELQERYQIPPRLLEIELTETMVFENLEFLKQVVDDIHSMGFTCSMDDFGSGYSSLNVLKDVPVDILKLDRVFFDKDNDVRGNDVIESVIHLAKKLGMATISEGVETHPQVEFLKQVNCDMVQGYVFSRPLPIENFEKLVFTSKNP